MPKMPPREGPRQTLSTNLRALMKREKLSEEALGKRAGVAQKTINKILNGRSAARIDTLDKIAAAFNLQGWHLLMQQPVDLICNPSVEKLYRSYVDASPEGREMIDRVAEREAKYSKK